MAYPASQSLKSIFFFNLLFCVFLLSEHVYSAPCSLKKEQFTEIEHRLKTEKIIYQIPMDQFLMNNHQIVHFTTPVYLVELESGLKAVLKTTSWPRDAVAEVAAYKASCFLDLYLVPPTVFYNEDTIKGSLQYYVEPSFDLLVKEHYQAAMHTIAPEKLANLQLFYFVFGQWDPDPSNLIAVEVENALDFYLIDNAAIGSLQKVQYGDYPFVLCFPDTIWPIEEGPFPFQQVNVLPPDPTVWRQMYGHLLTEKQIKTLCHLKCPVHFVIWRGHFWRQYRFGEPSHTFLYPDATITAIKKLNQENVQNFFNNDWGIQFSEEYIQDILERRNQVLSAYHSF